MAENLCGVVLHPAGHTLSPVLHEAAYAELGLDAHYAVFDVPAGGLSQLIDELRGRGLRQLSVSLPHKHAALELADERSPAAEAIGAANTLTVREDGHLVADNTDWLGVRGSLAPHGDWTGKRALVLGAGGAARGVVYALLDLGMRVGVWNRNPERALSVARDLGAEPAGLDAPHDLLANATSVGMEPEVESSPFPTGRLRPDALVFDAVYRPLETRLLAEARAAGCRTQDGLEMLVLQAAEQIALWSGLRPDRSLMRKKALQALGSATENGLRRSR